MSFATPITWRQHLFNPLQTAHGELILQFKKPDLLPAIVLVFATLAALPLFAIGGLFAFKAVASSAIATLLTLLLTSLGTALTFYAISYCVKKRVEVDTRPSILHRPSNHASNHLRLATNTQSSLLPVVTTTRGSLLYQQTQKLLAENILSNQATKIVEVRCSQEELRTSFKTLSLSEVMEHATEEQNFIYLLLYVELMNSVNQQDYDREIEKMFQQLQSSGFAFYYDDVVTYKGTVTKRLPVWSTLANRLSDAVRERLVESYLFQPTMDGLIFVRDLDPDCSREMMDRCLDRTLQTWADNNEIWEAQALFWPHLLNRFSETKKKEFLQIVSPLGLVNGHWAERMPQFQFIPLHCSLNARNGNKLELLKMLMLYLNAAFQENDDRRRVILTDTREDQLNPLEVVMADDQEPLDSFEILEGHFYIPVLVSDGTVSSPQPGKFNKKGRVIAPSPVKEHHLILLSSHPKHYKNAYDFEKGCFKSDYEVIRRHNSDRGPYAYLKDMCGKIVKQYAKKTLRPNPQG